MGGDASWLGSWGQLLARRSWGHLTHKSRPAWTSCPFASIASSLESRRDAVLSPAGQVRSHGAQCAGLEIFARGVPSKVQRVSVFSQRMVAF